MYYRITKKEHEKSTIIFIGCIALIRHECISPDSNRNHHYTAKAGINIGTLTDESSSKARIGIAARVEVSYQLVCKFGLSTGVMYSQQGTKLAFDKLRWNHERGAYKLDYINVPVMANFYITKGLVLKAGLQYGYNINKKIDIKGITADIDVITENCVKIRQHQKERPFHPYGSFIRKTWYCS